MGISKESVPTSPKNTYLNKLSVKPLYLILPFCFHFLDPFPIYKMHINVQDQAYKIVSKTSLFHTSFLFPLLRSFLIYKMHINAYDHAYISLLFIFNSYKKVLIMTFSCVYLIFPILAIYYAHLSLISHPACPFPLPKQFLCVFMSHASIFIHVCHRSNVDRK